MTSNHPIDNKNNPVQLSRPSEDRYHSFMSLEVAFQSLENARKMNLQVEFGREIGDEECVLCLRRPIHRSRFQRWRTKRKFMQNCFLCGSSVCKAHRYYLSNRINASLAINYSSPLCLDCWGLLSTEGALRGILNFKTEKDTFNRILETYDRARLIYLYSLPLIPERPKRFGDDKRRWQLEPWIT